jgi:hypothetical protein
MYLLNFSLQYSSIQTNVKIPASSEILGFVTKINEQQAYVNECQDKALAVRKQITNIPMLERKAKARIAEAKLRESQDGRAILDSLTSEFEQDFLALPAN